MAYRPSQNTMKVIISKTDPNTGVVKKYYENSYLWNS